MTFVLDEFEIVELIQDISVSFLTVDFGKGAIANCDWNAGRCDLVKTELRFCVNQNLAGAVLGC